MTVRKGDATLDDFSILPDVSTKKRFVSSDNLGDIANFISAKGGMGAGKQGSTRTFGTMNRKVNQGDAYEIDGVEVYDDTITFDSDLYASILADEKVAVKRKALTRSDIKWLDALEKRLVDTDGIAGNQIIANRIAMRSILVKLNGKKGSGRGYIDFPDDINLRNPEGAISNALDNAAGKAQGLLKTPTKGAY